MSFLTEFSIAPKLQMDGIFPFKKKIIVRNLVWFPNVGDHRCTPGPFITSKEFGVLEEFRQYLVPKIRRYALVQLKYLSAMLYVIAWRLCSIVYRLPVSEM